EDFRVSRKNRSRSSKRSSRAAEKSKTSSSCSASRTPPSSLASTKSSPRWASRRKRALHRRTPPRAKKFSRKSQREKSTPPRPPHRSARFANLEDDDGSQAPRKIRRPKPLGASLHGLAGDSTLRRLLQHRRRADLGRRNAASRSERLRKSS